MNLPASEGGGSVDQEAPDRSIAAGLAWALPPPTARQRVAEEQLIATSGPIGPETGALPHEMGTTAAAGGGDGAAVLGGVGCAVVVGETDDPLGLVAPTARLACVLVPPQAARTSAQAPSNDAAARAGLPRLPKADQTGGTRPTLLSVGGCRCRTRPLRLHTGASTAGGWAWDAPQYRRKAVRFGPHDRNGPTRWSWRSWSLAKETMAAGEASAWISAIGIVTEACTSTRMSDVR